MAKRVVESPITGSVWTNAVGVGQHVTEGTTLVILECMKMEITVEAPCDGEVTWLKASGDTVNQGDAVAILDDVAKP
jgi:biotin carboxyl carrier protein